MMSSVKIRFFRLSLVNSANVMKIRGKTIPMTSHHFDPKTIISSRIPDNNGILFGTKNMSKLKQITKFRDAMTIGIILFFFMILR